MILNMKLQNSRAVSFGYMNVQFRREWVVTSGQSGFTKAIPVPLNLVVPISTAMKHPHFSHISVPVHASIELFRKHVINCLFYDSPTIYT